MQSLWGEDFTIKEPDTKKILRKAKEPKEVKPVSAKKVLKSKQLTLNEKLELIKKNVYDTLGVYVEDTLVISDKLTLKTYIDSAIANKIISIDTETNNSLDPITCKIMGLCIYTPNQKAAYVPINHVDKDTHERLEWQLTEKDINEELSRLKDTFTILHNGKFDYKVLKCTCHYECRIDWDTLIGAKLLDENEKSAGLKQQYIQKIDPSIEKYSIEELFEHIEYAVVDPNLFALYAATDSMMTYKLYQYQVKKFNDPDNSKLLWLANNIEMPLVKVIAEMELAGMEVDQEYAQRLSNKYHKQLEEIDKAINEEYIKLKPKIAAWKLSPGARTISGNDANGRYHYIDASGGPGDMPYWVDTVTHKQLSVTEVGELGLKVAGKVSADKLDDPINWGSPTQLAILFYDILKCPTVNKKKPRSTGEEELKTLAEKMKLPLFGLLLKRRELVKLLSTYIDSIPELAKRWPDGRVRTHFNQYGAATGRLSSSEPLNFQNIPAHNKAIRMLFKAAEGYRIVGGDFSAQEPRLTAFYSQDENMINAYKEGKDLYSVIASMSFDRSYEDCLEFYPEGTVIEFEGEKVVCGYKTHQNKEGKNYRSMAKSILLGVLYGRGAASVGEQIGKSRDEAQEIIDKFFSAFPKVKQWIDASQKSAHEIGYVEDIAGRRRRLPDIQLDRFAIIDNNTYKSLFNPLLGAKAHTSKTTDRVKYYKDSLDRARNKKDVDIIKNQAKADNIEITDNTGFIAQAERQSVNARVQGGAATLTKCALLRIYHDSRIKAINARLINTVHDEILLEAPIEHSEEAEKLLVEDMVDSAKELVTNVPMKCDTYNVRAWYSDELSVQLESEYKKLFEQNPNTAIDSLYSKYTELTKDQIDNLIYNHKVLGD